MQPRPGHPLTRLMRLLREDPRWTAALVAVNLVAIVYGYYYYWSVGQFDPASRYHVDWWWWAFVADSPNAVVLMTVALVAWHLGVRSRVLDGLAFVHMVYVGLWTTYLFLLYPDQLGTFQWGSTNNVLFFTHLGMPLEALVLLPHILSRRHPAWGVPAMAAWAGLHLFLDYGPLAPWLGYEAFRPAPFVAVGPALAIGSTVLMALTVAWWAWAALRNA